MKTIHTITDDRAIREFRMCQACVNTSERRVALRGIYFQFSDLGASITATEGKRLVHVSNYPLERDIGYGDSVDMIVSFKRMIPRGTISLTLTVDHEDGKAVLTAVTKRTTKLIAGEVLADVTFPDYQRILDTNRLGPDRLPTVSSIGFNPLLVSELYEAFKPNSSAIGCEFRFGSDMDPIRVHIDGTDADIVVIPMRV